MNATPTGSARRGRPMLTAAVTAVALGATIGALWAGLGPAPAEPVSEVRLPDASDLLPSTLARAMLQGARPEELRPVGRGKVFTTDDVQRRTRILVTRSGTLVEIVGRGGTDYLLSPTDPVATAGAVEQAIRARR